MTKYDLLRWLDAPDIQEKIRQIVAEPKKIPMPEKFSPPKPDDNPQLETENRRLTEKLRAAELDKNSLRGELSKTQQRVKELEQQIQTAQFRNSRLENSLSQSEQSARSLQDKLTTPIKKFQSWRRNFNSDLLAAGNSSKNIGASAHMPANFCRASSRAMILRRSFAAAHRSMPLKRSGTCCANAS